jgi:hypothetical protein
MKFRGPKAHPNSQEAYPTTLRHRMWVGFRREDLGNRERRGQRGVRFDAETRR